MKKSGKPPVRDAYDVEVGERLKLLCKALTTSQRALAHLSGMTEQQWHNAQVGSNLITVPNAVKLCEVTGVTLDWIYRGQVTSTVSVQVMEKILHLRVAGQKSVKTRKRF